jgi:hypothetical protein
MTYGTLISSVTVGAGGASSIDFTSIPATYTDLCVVLSARSNAGDNVAYFRVNTATTSFSQKFLMGTGASAVSGSDTQLYVPVSNSGHTANTFGNTIIYIPNYTSSANKTFSIDGANENNSTDVRHLIEAGLWSNTAAITSIQIPCPGGSFVQYSTAYLYGLLKGSGGATAA